MQRSAMSPAYPTDYSTNTTEGAPIVFPSHPIPPPLPQTFRQRYPRTTKALIGFFVTLGLVILTAAIIGIVIGTKGGAGIVGAAVYVASKLGLAGAISATVASAVVAIPLLGVAISLSKEIFQACKQFCRSVFNSFKNIFKRNEKSNERITPGNEVTPGAPTTLATEGTLVSPLCSVAKVATVLALESDGSVNDCVGGRESTPPTSETPPPTGLDRILKLNPTTDDVRYLNFIDFIKKTSGQDNFSLDQYERMRKILADKLQEVNLPKDEKYRAQKLLLYTVCEHIQRILFEHFRNYNIHVNWKRMAQGMKDGRMLENEVRDGSGKTIICGESFNPIMTQFRNELENHTPNPEKDMQALDSVIELYEEIKKIMKDPSYRANRGEETEHNTARHNSEHHATLPSYFTTPR